MVIGEGDSRGRNPRSHRHVVADLQADLMLNDIVLVAFRPGIGPCARAIDLVVYFVVAPIHNGATKVGGFSRRDRDGMRVA